MNKNSLSYYIELNEYNLAKLQFVHSHFPDAIVNKYYNLKSKYGHNPEFRSKIVNKNFSKIHFFSLYNELYVAPIVELDFKYNKNNFVKNEKIVVGSIPASNRLVYTKTIKQPNNKYVETICFSKFKFNLEKNKFRKDLLGKCQVQVAQFIQQHSDLPIDDSHLDERIKKLLTLV